MEWTKLAEHLTEPQANVVFCAMIAVFGVYVVVELLRSMRRARASTLAFTAVLKSLPDEHAEAVERLRAAAQDRGGQVYTAWREYSLHLFEVPNTQRGARELRCARSAHEFFDNSSIIQTQLRPSFLAAAPNLLTGLGLLGTFVGLAAGVATASANLEEALKTPAATEATQSLAAPGRDLLMEGLGKLLGGSALAFWTSIVGLLFSLVLTMLIKQKSVAAAGEVLTLADGLDARFPVLSVEDVAARQLLEMQLQTDQLHRFNTELALSIAGALDERVASRVSPALERLIGAIEGLRAERSSSNEALLQDLVRRFESTFMGATGDQFEGLKSGLSALANQLHHSMEAYAKTQQEIMDVTLKTAMQAAQTLEGGSTTIQAGFERTTTMLVEKVSQAVTTMQDALASASTFAAENSRSMIQSLSEAQTEVLGDLRSAMAAAVDRSALTSSEIQRELIAAVSAISRTMSENAAETAKTFSDSTRGSAQAVESSLRGLNSLVGTLADAVGGSESSLKAADAVVAHAASVLFSLQRAHEQIQGVLSTLSSLSATSSKASENHRVAGESSLAASEAFLRGSQEVKTSLGVVEKSWAQYQERFANVDVSLGKIFQQIDLGLAAYTSKVREFVRDLDGHLAKSIDKLSAVAEELSSTAEDLQLQEVTKRLSEVSQAFVTASRRLEELGRAPVSTYRR